MKHTASAVALAVLVAGSSQAQVFRPSVAGGAVLGGAAGAIIGHNDGRHGWEGALYGAAAGAVIASLASHQTDQHRHRTQVPVPHYTPGFGPYPVVYERAPVYYSPAPVYVESTPAPRTSYAATGTLLGGIAGAIIGHNDGRHGWEGAAYGAGAGLILGSLADSAARRREEAQVTYVQPTPAETTTSTTTSTTTPPPQNVTIINNYYGNNTPMASANGLFGR